VTNRPCRSGVDDPLVIAIEGLCYAGKTTLAHVLAPIVSGVVIAEYGELAAPPPFPPRDLDDVTAALKHFLRLEREWAAAARVANAPVVLLDRSPLTLIAHEHGIACLGVPCDSRGAAEMYTTAAESREILTPDAYLYLHVPKAVAAARQARRGPIAAHLMHPQVRAGIDRACRTYLTALPPWLYLELDGTAAPSALAATAASFLSELTPAPAAPGWRILAASPRAVTWSWM
jgi:thymidylate kinase